MGVRKVGYKVYFKIIAELTISAPTYCVNPKK